MENEKSTMKTCDHVSSRDKKKSLKKPVGSYFVMRGGGGGGLRNNEFCLCGLTRF